jgi:hypothetical protein
MTNDDIAVELHVFPARKNSHQNNLQYAAGNKKQKQTSVA